VTTIDDESDLDVRGGDTHASAEAVRQVTLDLLASLPQRPERLRVSAAGVAVDIDWRPTGAAPAPATHLITSGTATVSTPATTDVHPSLEAPPDNRFPVVSPTVGTFYSAAEPGAQPFVAEGDLVSSGQQIGIVEAMKLMLPIKAEQAGRVAEILVKDGQSVEFGEHLLLLLPGEG
jgi:acetyl-CoA carboxylase biotin carboxyl carrier protein